jgi:hypothetical protein
MIIAQFKDSDNSDKKKSQVGKKIGGVALLGGSAAIGTQSIRSGLPRALGVRLEQHGTSKASAKAILSDYPEAKGRWGKLKPSLGGVNPNGFIVGMGFDKYKNDPVLKHLPDEYKDVIAFFEDKVGGFQERGKHHVFISGKNANHPNWNKRNKFSSVTDVLTRKVQVAGYRGTKTGNITDADRRGAEKIFSFLDRINSFLTKVSKGKVPNIKESMRKNLIDSGLPKSEVDDTIAEVFEGKPTNVKRAVKSAKQLKAIEKIRDTASGDKILKELGYTQEPIEGFVNLKKYEVNKLDTTSYDKFYEEKAKLSRSEQKRLLDNHDLYNEMRDKYKQTTSTLEVREIVYDAVNDAYVSSAIKEVDLNPKLNKLYKQQSLAKTLLESPKIKALEKQATNNIGMYIVKKPIQNALAQVTKLLKSIPIGMTGLVGSTLYVPGTDEYFNDTNRFKFDQDDPFGEPPFLGKGNALKTKEEVKVFKNRLDATKSLLKEQGNGNYFKGASKLMGANKGRVLAGLGILGVGGTAAGLLGAKGIQLLKSDKPRNKRSKVKSYVRKGKLVQTFERLNPFYNKDKRNKDK